MGWASRSPLRVPFHLGMAVMTFKCTQVGKFIARVLDLEAAPGDGLRHQGKMFGRADGDVI